MWRDDYLAGLRERGYARQAKRDASCNRQPQVNEVVLVHDDSAPRACWKLARILALIKNAEDQVTTARIRFANRHETHRAINHLFPLELGEKDLEISPTAQPSTPDPPSPPGGFGPFGLEEEAPEDDASDVPVATLQLGDHAPIASRTRHRIAAARYAHWPHVFFSQVLRSPRIGKLEAPGHSSPPRECRGQSRDLFSQATAPRFSSLAVSSVADRTPPADPPRGRFSTLAVSSTGNRTPPDDPPQGRRGQPIDAHTAGCINSRRSGATSSVDREVTRGDCTLCGPSGEPPEQSEVSRGDCTLCGPSGNLREDAASNCRDNTLC